MAGRGGICIFACAQAACGFQSAGPQLIGAFVDGAINELTEAQSRALMRLQCGRSVVVSGKFGQLSSLHGPQHDFCGVVGSREKNSLTEFSRVLERHREGERESRVDLTLNSA